MNYEQNPFPPGDPDRHELWEMLVRRDIDAFLAGDWSMVAEDFVAEHFLGIHGHFLASPDSWRLAFPTVDAYREEWLRQAAETAETRFAEPLREALFRATHLRDIDVRGERAVLHKKFDGRIRKADGTDLRLDWQTLYFCSKRGGRWRITGFLGYIPRRLG